MKNKSVYDEKIEGMETYKIGLLLWLEHKMTHLITKEQDDDVRIGKLNAYSEIIGHIKGNLRKKRKTKI